VDINKNARGVFLDSSPVEIILPEDDGTAEQGRWWQDGDAQPTVGGRTYRTPEPDAPPRGNR